MNFGEVIEAFEEAGVDVRQAYWSDGTYIDLELIAGDKHFVVSGVEFTPIGTGERGKILVDIKETPL